MNKDNNLGRVLALLSLTLLMSFGLYSLPDTLFGYKIKKVDLLSDFKVKEEKLSLDSLKQQLEQADTLQVDSVALRDSIMRSAGIDSAALALRDSLYKAVYAVQGADSLGAHIEDYSLGHIGLQRFFAALKNRRELNRPVRVAFLGDSFIEGDIMVADFRSGMQKEFGGRGVGFVPVTSVAAQFRPTVEQRASGWTTWSMLTDHEHGYTLSGMMFEANEENASIHVKTTKRYPELQTFSSLKLIYEQNKNTEMRLVCNASADTLQEMLPATSIVTQYELEGMFTEADFTFKNTPEFRALGVAMEDHSGVVVDNFSLRGNSGMILERLDVSRCQALNKIRPYDLPDQAFHDILQGYDTLDTSELIRNESIFHVCLLERFQGIIYALVLGNELCRAKYLVDREIRLVDPSEQIFQINDSYYIIELLRSHGIYIK